MTRVNLYVDDTIWRRFRQQVFTKYGTLTKLNDEVEALMSSEDTREAILSGSQKLDVKIDPDLQPNDIKRLRPKLRGGSAEKIVRDKRDEGRDGHVYRKLTLCHLSKNVT